MTIRPLASALAFALVASPLTTFAQAPAAAATDTTTAPATAPVAPTTTTVAPVAPTEERPTTYTMVTGDSLDSVAKKFDTSIKALAKLNKIPKEKYRKLRAGTVLQIPPAKTEAAAPAVK